MLTMRLLTSLVATATLFGIALTSPNGPAVAPAAVLPRDDSQITTSKKTTTTISMKKPSSTKKTTTTTSKKSTATSSIKKPSSTVITSKTTSQTTSKKTIATTTITSPSINKSISTKKTTETTKPTTLQTTTPTTRPTTTTTTTTATSVSATTTPLCNLEHGVRPGLLSPTQGQHYFYDPTPGSNNSIVITIIYCSAQYTKTKSISGDVWLGMPEGGQILKLHQLPDNKDVDPHSPYYSYHFNVTYNPIGVDGYAIGPQRLNFYEVVTGLFYEYGYSNNYVTLNIEQWPRNNPGR